MKKKYEAPTAEAVKFEYKDQVVAASSCSIEYRLEGIPCNGETPIRHNN